MSRRHRNMKRVYCLKMGCTLFIHIILRPNSISIYVFRRIQSLILLLRLSGMVSIHTYIHTLGDLTSRHRVNRVSCLELYCLVNRYTMTRNSCRGVCASEIITLNTKLLCKIIVQFDNFRWFSALGLDRTHL